jgi:alpha-tubulin suppressor-like RCC1 family protein
MRVRRLISGFAIPLAAAVAVAGGLAAGPAAAATGAAAARVRPAATTSVMSWGDNSAGELGNGTLTPSTKPVATGGSGGIRAISSGGRHVLGLTSGGTVLAWGDDTAGQLGNGAASANNDAENPATVSGLAHVTQVSAGAEHSLALLSNGTVEAWGDNSHGELGDGTTTSSAVPVPVTGLTGVKYVAAGQLYSAAVLDNGTVMTWGAGGNAQLGDGTLADSDVPVPVKGLTGVTAVAAGGQHVLALKSNGTVEAWGADDVGQLGDGGQGGGRPVKVTGLTGVVAVSAGQQFSLALLSDGEVMGWGDNGFNELAQSDSFPGGIGSSNVPVPLPGLAHVTAISAGALYGLALLPGGTVDGWGDGAFGQLGNGTTSTLTTPAAVSGLTGASAISAGGASSAALVAAAAPAPPAPVPVPSIWQAETTVNPQATHLTGSGFAAVSASGPSDAWAVGTHSDTKAADHPLAEHRVGGTWTQVPVPQPAGQQASLAGVDDLTPDNAWAVGTSGGLTLIEHWNGKRWSIVPSPNPATGTAGDSDTLTSISGTGPGNLWAAGWDLNEAINTIQLLFEHWNGTTWTAATSPTPTGSAQFASGITAISPGNVWAVGTDRSDGVKTLSAHWNGTAWSIVPPPDISNKGDQNLLTGVSSDGAGQVWAAGYADDDGQNFRVPYVLHWTGSTWVLTKVPNPGSEGSQLSGIAVLSPADIWTAGTTEQTDGGQLALTEQFNGTSWTVSPAADPGQLAGLSDNVLAGVASSGPGSLLVAGSQETPGQEVGRTLALTTTKG